MSDGIRIRPLADLGYPGDAMIVVTDHARPFPPPADGTPLEVAQPACSVCSIDPAQPVQHFAKTYHLQLRAGSVIVSSEVWENLQRLADHPFEFANVVSEPPAQGIAPGTDRAPVLIEKFVMPITTTAKG